MVRNNTIYDYVYRAMPFGAAQSLSHDETYKIVAYLLYMNEIIDEEFILSEKNIGIIKMEVIRNEPPKNNFLRKVRNLADKNNIVLIFDECTSGFRETFGGLHKKYNIEPDMAMYGKTLGNGYAITAVVGKREIMESAQRTFISSTFWTERIGPTAALASLEVMEKIKSWELITEIGLKMQKGWDALAKSNNLDITINGLPPITNYTFNYSDSLEYKTFITQEMLKKGFLASTNFYACIDHTDSIMNSYFESLDKIFKVTRGQHPILIKTYLAKRISIETMCILQNMLNYAKKFDKTIKDTIIWPQLKTKIVKYGPFIKYNPERMKLILRGMIK